MKANSLLVAEMTEIVEFKMKQHKRDFYKYDIDNLEEYRGLFFWLVRESGTHFVKLEGNKDEIIKRIESYKKVWNKGNDEINRFKMYAMIGDSENGKTREIETFSEVMEIVHLLFEGKVKGYGK